MEKTYKMFLKIAGDEIQTILQYTELLENVDETSEETDSIVDEILSDEFNHALVALLSAAHDMGITIAPDTLDPNPNTIQVVEEGGEEK